MYAVFIVLIVHMFWAGHVDFLLTGMGSKTAHSRPRPDKFEAKARPDRLEARPRPKLM
jgi:hypothetical protein